MKLKETLNGNGEVFDNETNLGKISYKLNVYQEIHTVNNQEVEGLKSIMGNITSEDAMRLFHKDELTLVLEDGRCIKFFVRNSNGEIRCSGGFFQKEN
ncbi:MAG TPA: hypothetical protein VF599_05810 [Pyrinomonadaceae bacterium]|jgi:predicted LPLAT superfamily acyltransferase